MKRICSFLLGVFCLAPLTLNSQTMSHEEEVVRNAYAKFSTLCAIEALSKVDLYQSTGRPLNQQSFDAFLQKKVPTFTLTDFRSGPIADIADQSWGSLVTDDATVPEILAASTSGHYYTDNGNTTNWMGLQAYWTKPHPPSDAGTAMMQRPVSKVIAIASPYWSGKDNPVTYTRYVAFTVDALLDGKTTGPHKVLWLIGTDSHGKEFVAENDLISGTNTKIWGLLSLPSYPTAFLQSPLRNNPLIAACVRSNEMPASSCDASKRDLCCSKGRCGISQTDLNRDLAAPLPEPKGGLQ